MPIPIFRGNGEDLEAEKTMKQLGRMGHNTPPIRIHPNIIILAYKHTKL